MKEQLYTNIYNIIDFDILIFAIITIIVLALSSFVSYLLTKEDLTTKR